MLTLRKSLEKPGPSVQCKGEKVKASSGPIGFNWENGPFDIQ